MALNGAKRKNSENPTNIVHIAQGRPVYTYMGKSGPLSEAERNRCIVQHMNLVAPVAHKYRGGSVDWDDLLAAGREGLVRAAKAFDPSKGAFPPRAAKYIDNSILDFIRSEKSKWYPKDEAAPDQDERDKIERIFEWDAWGDFGNSIAILENWSNVGVCPEALSMAFERIEERKDRFAAAFLSLSSVQRKLFRLCYMMTPRVEVSAAARELRISRYWASRSLKRALETMREVIARIDANQRGIADAPSRSEVHLRGRRVTNSHGRHSRPREP